jgi:hypothetical protein
MTGKMGKQAAVYRFLLIDYAFGESSLIKGLYCMGTNTGLTGTNMTA